MNKPSQPLPKAKHDRVDWQSQWAQFAPGFANGLAHIQLAPFGANAILRLLPGAGFGDLSHPTTSLMLALMSGKMLRKAVLDIGCGSGILSLAALMMGASHAHGIDIDPAALSHSQQNAELNQLENSSHFSTSLPDSAKGVVLINMILSEQKEVLEQIPDLPQRASLWIASGFLAEQRKEAKAFFSRLGLQLIEEKKQGEWLAFTASKVFETVY